MKRNVKILKNVSYFINTNPVSAPSQIKIKSIKINTISRDVGLKRLKKLVTGKKMAQILHAEVIEYIDNKWGDVNLEEESGFFQLIRQYESKAWKQVF